MSKANEISNKQAEHRQLVSEMTQVFINTVQFYKSEQGGSKPHEDAVKEALLINGSIDASTCED